MLSSYSTEPSISISVKTLQPRESKLMISAPIKIPKVSSNERIEEYALTFNFFNPGKMSPPDIWKNRLEQRIKTYFEESDKNDDKE